MSRTTLILLAAGGSAALLAAAFGFQHIGGYAPCQMCLWQRWPHAAAVVIGLLALLLKGRTLPWLGALAALATAAIAAYHSGVERKWWPGPASCSSGSIEGLSVDQLLDPTIVVAAPVPCDEIVWQMFGLTMPNLNLFASLALAAVWVMAAQIRRR
ncbi:disulfide bond formation protein B [Aliigemmobacter aestuarii]|uniref:Disulfide bond formation protein B n=1 Tax=Aliigemmobacter aestuarii TaxID=1445661 RepID=A0A4S3MP50_9RHOB|nr:disulfide bond formation protein B [Gemmobacter aestuarii]THD84250.1 disulfide bond formation protein B [Gemmobacter aestuarii]